MNKFEVFGIDGWVAVLIFAVLAYFAYTGLTGRKIF